MGTPHLPQPGKRLSPALPLPPHGSSSGPPSPGMRRRRKPLTTITNIGGGCAWAPRTRSPRPAAPPCPRRPPERSARQRRPALPPRRGAWPRTVGGLRRRRMRGAAAGPSGEWRRERRGPLRGPAPRPRSASSPPAAGAGSSARGCRRVSFTGAIARGGGSGVGRGVGGERWGPGVERGPAPVAAPGRRGNPRGGGARQAAGGPGRSLPAVRCQGRAARRSYSGE